MRAILYSCYIFISAVFGIFIERHERVEAELGVLLLLGQIENQELLHLEFLLGLSCLGRRLTRGTSHLVADEREPLYIFHPFIFVFLLMACPIVKILDLLAELTDLILHVLLLKTLFNQRGDQQLVLFIQALFRLF